MLNNRIKINLLTTLFIVSSILTGCSKKVDPKSLDFLGNETGKVQTEYANLFEITEYDSGYALLNIDKMEQTVLIVPEDKEIPDELPQELTVVKKPLKDIYVVSTGAMDFFVSSNSLDTVKFASLNAEDWYIDEAKTALENGEIIYAGKYSMPDYELLRDKECQLIIENSMITHTPEVLNELKNLGFPVIIEAASYEDEPLGRMEWIKLIGYLTGHEEEANEAFNKQREKVLSIEQNQTENKPTAIIFSITSAGTVSVRKTDDYMVKMLQMAGADHGLTKVEEGNGSTTIQQEAFYDEAINADYLIYNSSIEGEIDSITALEEKFPLIKKTKAYKEGRITCLKGNTYQSVMSTGDLIFDLSRMLEDEKDLEYLYWL